MVRLDEIAERSAAGHEFSVDAYVDHMDLEEKLQSRIRMTDGWKVARLIQCSSCDKREYVTIIWSRPMFLGEG